MVRAALRWEISGLRVSSKRFPSAPCRHASPLEMTMLASAPLVISTEAKRSGLISRLNGQESGCGFRRWLFRRAVKGKVDGPPARGFLRFLSLTRLRREGGGGGFAADDKVSVTRLAFYLCHRNSGANFIKKGRGWRRRLCRRAASLRSGAPEADQSPNEPMHPRPLPTGGIIGNILIMYKN